MGIKTSIFTEATDITNYFINGSLDIKERGESFTYSGNGANENYNFDRIRRSGSIASAPTMDLLVESSNDLPAVLSEAGLQNSMRILNNAVVADGSDNVDEFGFVSNLEKRHIQKLLGKKVRASFWAKANRNMALSFQLVAASATTPTNHVFEFNPTNTWQKFDFAVDLSTAIHDVNDTSSALAFVFELYQNFNTYAAPSVGEYNQSFVFRGLQSQENFLGTVGNELFLAGFMISEDNDAEDIPFVRAGKNLEGERFLAKRYFERQRYSGTGQVIATGYVQSSGTIHATIPYFEKRVTPTISSTFPSQNGLIFRSRNADLTISTSISTSFAQRGPTKAVWVLSRSNSIGNGSAGFFRANTATEGYIDIDAEL